VSLGGETMSLGDVRPCHREVLDHVTVRDHVTGRCETMSLGGVTISMGGVRPC